MPGKITEGKCEFNFSGKIEGKIPHQEIQGYMGRYNLS
jgi:hypothetical protein